MVVMAIAVLRKTSRVGCFQQLTLLFSLAAFQPVIVRLDLMKFSLFVGVLANQKEFDILCQVKYC
jgi:hypothetical protein